MSKIIAIKPQKTVTKQPKVGPLHDFKCVFQRRGYCLHLMDIPKMYDTHLERNLSLKREMAWQYNSHAGEREREGRDLPLCASLKQDGDPAINTELWHASYDFCHKKVMTSATKKVMTSATKKLIMTSATIKSYDFCHKKL